MASEYRIHKPYVLSTLPRPLGHTDSRIVAKEVYGQRDGLRKKRTELAVGIDESFTCPPHSIRIRRTGSSDVSRYTYIATKDGASYKITLFKDVVHSDGKTTSTTETKALRKSPVLYVTTSGPNATSAVGNVIAVCENGDVFSLRENLALLWSSSAKSVVDDVSSAAVSGFEVDFAISGTVAEFSDGMFKSRPEVYTSLPKSAGAEPVLLALVSKSATGGTEGRHLLVLAVGTGESSADAQRLTPLDVAPFTAPAGVGRPKYHFEVQSGTLLQLQDGALTVFDLTGDVPKVKSIIQMEEATTFTRLSRPFVLAMSADSIGLYNYQYRSVHAMSQLDLSDLPAESQQAQSFELISYLRSQDTAVALVDNTLVCIHIEPPKSNGRRRKAGLLIDSIGRGTAVEIPAKRARTERPAPEFSHTLPGTITEEYLRKHHAEEKEADQLLNNDAIAEWEAKLRGKFGVDKVVDGAPNGFQATGNQVDDEVPAWEWCMEPTAYPAVDRRWVLYGITRVFTVDVGEGSEDDRLRLRLLQPDSNVMAYLAVAGHLTMTNLHAAFREEMENAARKRSFASDLIQCLTEADPSLTLLLNYLRATKLGEVEVLLAIRAIMSSMDLITTAGDVPKKQLTASAHAEGQEDMDLDDLEREIAVTEHYLGDESSTRSRGLTLAFTKLWRLPSRTTVKALATALQTEEILALIHLLRIELVRGAWTSLYIDPPSFDAEGNEPPPDGVIALISDLLGRCLDAIGSGGWLLNDALDTATETGDILAALKLEVAAALDGMEEAVFLNGALGEVVRYGRAAGAAASGTRTINANKPITVAVESKEGRMLPLGLKAKTLPKREKVVSGGEVVMRSSRETGHLISQKVEAYSLEKLAI
ncbi:uncharacterized protein J7T54_004241 [Emericellopsis cladophorae]|uniref:Uncharacterized protein n=1 Tax=Emericellopsis cladophorae TaxID=2686198 RepID=A0A9Q0BDF1_9HYPO|nr:uncharacterized protein J7T54_004241 [Emericellopsis cladophorae]KAI6780109.1 hypothetical protein J7T54_004241 [Emericellopsis cladophorae]